MNNKPWFSGALVIVILVGVVIVVSGKKGPSQTTEENVNLQETLTSEATSEGKSMQEPPAMQIDKSKAYQAVLTTSEGEITIQLFADKTPLTVNNFISLARKGFYSGTIFHRVIKGFMIQGGDPKGDGTGGPGYTFADEPFEGEYKRGTVAMANAGPNTNGSQFFIMHQSYDLPKNYVIFGQVVSGLETVDKIAEAPVVVSDSGENSKPVEPARVESVKIVEE